MGTTLSNWIESLPVAKSHEDKFVFIEGVKPLREETLLGQCVVKYYKSKDVFMVKWIYSKTMH